MRRAEKPREVWMRREESRRRVMDIGAGLIRSHDGVKKLPHDATCSDLHFILPFIY